MNNKGHMGIETIIGIVMGIVGLLVAVILISAFFPIMQEQFDDLRDQDKLNCESDTSCDTAGTNVSICYNSSKSHENATTCAIQSIGLPLLLILLIIGALGALVGTRAVMGY